MHITLSNVILHRQEKKKKENGIRFEMYMWVSVCVCVFGCLCICVYVCVFVCVGGCVCVCVFRLGCRSGCVHFCVKVCISRFIEALLGMYRSVSLFSHECVRINAGIQIYR
jgi:hypothetical protein